MNKQQLEKAIAANEKEIERLDKRREALRRKREKQSDTLAQVLAKEKGIEVGKQYRVIGENRRARIVEVKSIESTYRGNVSIKCYRIVKGEKAGVERFDTWHQEFIPMAQD
jgi:septal ring factor EnvC (AmiA/AmiB activator)